MLAAECAWRILDTEHSRLRHLLAGIALRLDDDAWQHRGSQLDGLRRLVKEFRDFEAETHRPKGVVLLGSMRGRSAPADELLDTLEQDRRQCDRRLGRALDLLEALEREVAVDVAEIAALLRQHRQLMDRHLDQEDTALRAYTARLLTPEEWSAVVSSISSAVHRPPGLR